MAPGQSEQRLVLPSRLDEVPRAEDAVLKDAMEAGFDEPACFAIKLSLEEALANAIKHGNSGDPEKQVVVTYRIAEDHIQISVCDEGGGFEPDVVPDPTLDENLEKPNGRGIMLMKAYMNEVCYNQAGNCVTMIKRRECRPSSATS
jgi:serine/threonine-protein kinase RsbW